MQKVILMVMGAIFNLHLPAQEIKPDLSNQNHFKVVNRGITIDKKGADIILHLDARPGDGIAWLEHVNFKTGKITFDVKGKNIDQRSFVGMAIHGQNDSTFEALYFRPFNFQSKDPLKKKHGVQYIAMPEYDWSFLREHFPGKYENALTRIVEADSWFHVSIIVDVTAIKVFVNGDNKSSLTITPLHKFSTGRLGFWVGNNSEGDFRGLKIEKNG